MSAQLDLPLSQVLVFEKTGRVLWRRGAPTLKGDPLSELVGAYLLEEKGGTQSARIGDHALDWRFVNEADLVVVTAAPASMELDWTGDLCDGIRKKVASLAKSGHVQEALRESFDPTFDGLEKEFEARLRIRRKKHQADLEARKARSAEAAQRRAEAEAGAGPAVGARVGHVNDLASRARHAVFLRRHVRLKALRPRGRLVRKVH